MTDPYDRYDLRRRIEHLETIPIPLGTASAILFGSDGVLFEPFLNVPPTSAAGGSILGFVQNASGTGAAIAQQTPPDAASIGVIRCRVANNGGRAGVFTYNASPGESLRFGGGQLDVSWRFQMPTLPDGSESYSITLGFMDAVNVSHTDGAYLFFSQGVTNFRYRTRSNSTETDTDSGLAPIAGTWYILRIIVNAAATSITFTINSANSQALTTNIPTGAGREVGIGAVIVKTASAANANRDLYLDYCRFAWSDVSA